MMIDNKTTEIGRFDAERRDDARSLCKFTYTEPRFDIFPGHIPQDIFPSGHFLLPDKSLSLYEQLNNFIHQTSGRNSQQ